MLTGNNPNIELLEKTVEKLGELADKMVFVGGCATGLLITDANAAHSGCRRDNRSQ